MLGRKQFVYHVFYSFQNGNGSMTIYRGRKIKTPDDVRDVKEFVEQRIGYKNVVVASWTKLKKSHVPD